MERPGLLQKAKTQKYRLYISSGDSNELEFSLVGEPAPDQSGGLLARARTLRRPAPTGDTPPTSQPSADEEAVDDEEDAEIRSEIEGLLSTRSISSDSLSFRPGEGSSGLRLPIMVNFIVIMMVAATLYTVTMLFNTRVEELEVESDEVFSAESRIIEQLIQSSEEEIAQKNEQINSIESQLNQLEESKAELEANLDERVAEREQQLRERLEQELAAERARLEEQGTSQAEINQRLNELENQRENQVEQQVASLRSDLESEFEARVSELEQESAQLEQRLQQERAELEEQVAQAEAETSAARDRLQSLQQEQELVSLFQDQLAGSYQTVFRAIRASDYDAARNALANVESIYETPSFSGIPTIQGRREIDSRLVETLRGLISQEERLTREITAIEGEAGAAAQERIQAQQALLDEQRAEIEQLQDEIAAVTAENADVQAELEQTRSELENTIATREQTIDELQNELTERAASQARQEDQIEELENRITSLEDNLDGLRSERDRRSEEIAVLEDQIQTLRRNSIDPAVAGAYSRRVRPGGPTAAASAGPSVPELLRTKLLLLRLANRPDVRADYPDLYDQAQVFFDDLVERERTDAAEATLSAVEEILSELVGGSDAGSVPVPELPGDEPRVRARLERLISAISANS